MVQSFAPHEIFLLMNNEQSPDFKEALILMQHRIVKLSALLLSWFIFMFMCALRIKLNPFQLITQVSSICF